MNKFNGSYNFFSAFPSSFDRISEHFLASSRMIWHRSGDNGVSNLDNNPYNHAPVSSDILSPSPISSIHSICNSKSLAMWFWLYDIISVVFGCFDANCLQISSRPWYVDVTYFDGILLRKFSRYNRKAENSATCLFCHSNDGKILSGAVSQIFC